MRPGDEAVADVDAAGPRRWRYQLFVAFAEADADWVRGYLLPAVGVAPEQVITVEDFRPGASVVAELERAVTESRLTVVVLSPAFLDDAWGAFGERLAAHAGVAEHRDRVVPVLVAACDLPLHVDFRVRLDCTDPDRWELELARLRRLIDQPEPETEEVRCPFPGMVPFGAEASHLFHGRESEIEELLVRLRHQRSLFVIGPSGCGKSSLVFAGVLPHLATGYGRNWVVRSLRPGPTPERALAQALGEGDDVDSMVRAALAVPVAPDQAARLLLVVDQLEEIFTQASPERRAAFISDLNRLRALDACVLVVTMRADFYPELMGSGLWPLTTGERVEIAPLRGPALARAIARPAAEVGVHLEPALVERLLADAADEPGALPLVQETMVQLWERRARRLLTARAYDDLGGEGRTGLSVAMATMADATLASLTPAQQLAARRVFLRLVQLGEGRQNTRRQQALGALRSVADESDVFDEALRRLTANRLLTLGGDEGTGETGETGETATVDLAHEALIGAWPTLQHWLEEDRELLVAHRRLTEAADEWERGGRADEGLLYRGSRLSFWQERDTGALNRSELAFLAAARRRQSRERRRVRLAVTSVLTLVSTVAVVALIALNQVSHERDLARSRQLAATALAQLEIDPERSLLLALRAAGDNRTPEAENAVRRSVLESRVRDSSFHGPLVLSAAFSPDGREVVSAGGLGTVQVWDRAGGGAATVLRGHQGVVFSAAFSPDGRRVVSAGADGTVRVWDRVGGGEATMVLRGHSGSVVSAAFSPDGRLVVSAGEDRTVRLWDWAGGTEARVLRGHEDWVESVVFSPDGLRVVSAGRDATVRVWDWAGDAEPSLLRHPDWVYSAAFSPDGRRVVSGGEDGAVRVWEWAVGGELAMLPNDEGAVTSVAFSPDGLRVASAGRGGTVRVWTWGSDDGPTVLAGHEGLVTSAAFSPDGRLVVSAGEDGTVRVWDASGAGAPTVLRGHRDRVVSAAFGPDGRLVASAGGDGTVRVWDRVAGGEPTVLSGHEGAAYEAAFSPDGTSVVSAGQDGTVRVWDLVRGGEPTVLRGHEGAVNSAAFSPDGRQVVSAGEDGTVRAWDLVRGGEPTVLRGHSGAVYGVSFSPDGRLVVSAGLGGAVRVWDLVRGGEPTVLGGHGAWTETAVFSPDGRRVVSAGEDGTVRVWDWPRGGEAVVLRGHEGTVKSAGFSPDGRSVVSTGGDGRLRVWDLSHPGRSFDLRGPGPPLHSAAFSADGRWVVTAGQDRTVRVWDCETCGPIEEVLELAGRRLTRSLTADERQAFIGGTGPRRWDGARPAPALVAIVLVSTGVILAIRRRMERRRPADDVARGQPE